MINGKVLVHLRAPVMTSSGYGAHGREILDYLLADDKYVVALESINWGNCGYLNEDNFVDKEKFKQYYSCMSIYEQLKDKGQFDLAIHVSIPNEFNRTAKVCIGVTAGIETDRVALKWIEKCNEMDLIVVPSEHSAKVLKGTVYNLKNNQTGQTQQARLNKPIFIIPEYFDKPKEIKPLDVKWETNKNLLFVGLWGGKGTFGEDRKNVADLIKLFITQFKDDPNVGLILKTQLVNGSARDREETVKRLTEIKRNFGEDKVKCKIHLLHQELSEEEMWGLYSHPQVTGMISLTHGEGFGRPLLEAAACGKPVLATNWSGHVDFLKQKNGFIPLDYTLDTVPDCQIWEDVIVKDSMWAKVEDKNVLKRMKRFVDSPKMIQEQAEEHVSFLEENYSREAVWGRWTEFFGNFIKPVEDQDIDISQDTPPQFLEHMQKKMSAADELRKHLDTDSDKKKVLYVMPQSAGDCLISTAIIDSLVKSRHAEEDFYVATMPQFRPLFSKLEREKGVKVIDYNHQLMFQAEIVKEVWDYVYSPGVNVQFTFSNWLLGNGEYSVRLLEEFAKNCNLFPGELTDYCVETKETSIPESAYIVVAPGGQKSAKVYKYWPDVISNIKEMFPGVQVVQVGSSDEDLVEGVLDYRGREFSESFFIIENALMLVGCDSFPAHAAGAMGTPHLVIYASTHASACAPLMLKKTVPQMAIEEDRCNPKCYKDSCMKIRDGKNCLSHIDPKSICHGIKTIVTKALQDEEK